MPTSSLSCSANFIMDLLPSLLFLLIITSTYPHIANSRPHNNFTDVASLLAFKDNVADPSQVLAANWTTNTSFCSWFGVICSRRHQRVASLNLYNISLQGTISPHLANLSFLSVLDLGNATLIGLIPDILSQLPRLRILNLDGNYLSGPIPSSLFNISSLIKINLARNNFSGPIPSNVCNSITHRLQIIALGVNQLTGQIPSSLAHCLDLQALALTYNNLTGNVPAELGSLRQLRQLYLAANQLTGKIPSSLGKLSNLLDLQIAYNNLEGEIPEELENLSNLQILYLHGNSLSGPIPSSLFNISSLNKIILDKNNFSGPIPSNVCTSITPRLQFISVSANQLTGHIPSSFSHCLDLQMLSLSYNNLTGNVPAELGSLRQLRYLYLSGNQLTGKIPSSLGNLTSLLKLEISENNLEGEIPKELGNLSNLQILQLATNSLTGSIPLALLNASKVTFFDVVYNNLTGTVPAMLGEAMPLLERLRLGANLLTGSLDFITSLSNCRNLWQVLLAQNELDGFIPNSVGNLSVNLLYFSIAGNHVKGKIPSGLGNLSNLIRLDLDNNELTGQIPPELGGLQKLQGMYLENNRIEGSLPSDLGQLTSLGQLYAGGNRLSGAIPDSVSNIIGLQYLSLAANILSSNIPKSLWSLRSLIELDLSHNALYGSIPPDVGNLNNLDRLDLSNNRLSGNISSAIGGLQMLTYLDLSNNSFHGDIPQLIGTLISIKYLNLSYNFLSGIIPNSLANLSDLDSLDLSFNMLEGQIPKGRVFSNRSIPYLKGNMELCGAPQLGLPPCSVNIAGSHSRGTLHALEYILPIIAVVIALSTLFLICKIQRRRKVQTLASTDSQCLHDHKVVSYNDLVRATDNFSQANLLGRGSFGTVFKGYLDDGLVVAVKVLNLEVEGALKSFDAECKVLCSVRHRNLMKIISVCSTSDFKAIILKYMPNGSLEQWLYSENYILNLLQRLNIMVDVSLALEYLHHHHPQVVLHCDLKPSNILLDEEMVAHVSDFGIAKLILDNSKSITSASIPGTIGYIAPEYGSTGKVSRMGDVYSFGILLLEIFTGKKSTDGILNGETSLAEYVRKAFPTTLLDIVDHNLFKDGCLTEQSARRQSAMYQCLSSVLELGLLCSNTSPKERIPMIDVVPRLQKIRVEYLSQPSDAKTKVSFLDANS